MPPPRRRVDNWGALLTHGGPGARRRSGELEPYDLSSGTAERTVAAGGSPALANHAVRPPRGPSRPVPTTLPVVNLWSGGGPPARCGGSTDLPEKIRFADETTLLVQILGGSSALWSCSVTELTCVALPVPDGGLLAAAMRAGPPTSPLQDLVTDR